MTDWLIFTDLDGTLLDHHNYSFAPAAELLVKLEQAHVPVIPISSKTSAEILALRQQLNNRHPFVVENGAGVVIPRDYFSIQPEQTDSDGDYYLRKFSPERVHWLALLAEAKSLFGTCFEHFAEMSATRIAELTGLSEADAELANQRGFGEPLLWHGDDDQRQQFIEWLQQKGATVLQGGRFMHVVGECDKGLALRWLVEQYQRDNNGGEIKSIALGDSQNDVAMLEAADIAVVIKSPVHNPPELNRRENLFYSKACGPAGWAEVINHYLSEYLN